MKKFVYILVAFVVFLSFTAVNVFAIEVNKAKEAEKTFAKAIAQDNGCNLSIDAQNVSDDEMKSVVGNVHRHREYGGGYGRDVKNEYSKMKIKKTTEYGVEVSVNSSSVTVGIKWKKENNGKEGIVKKYNKDGSITIIQYWVKDGIQYKYVYTHYN